MDFRTLIAVRNECRFSFRLFNHAVQDLIKLLFPKQGSHCCNSQQLLFIRVIACLLHSIGNGIFIRISADGSSGDKLIFLISNYR